MIVSTVALLAVPAIMPGASIALAQDANAKSASREHFNNGVAAFDAKRFGEAAEEFNTAYRLSPAFVVLYNIGQVNVSLGRSVEAVDAFEKYLRQGASAVPAARRRQVEVEMERQRSQIGQITVRTLPEGAEVRVDGVSVGTTPLGHPVRVTAGRHTVEAQLGQHAPAVRELDVAGRAGIVMELSLVAPAAPGPSAVAPSIPPTPQREAQAQPVQPVPIQRTPDEGRWSGMDRTSIVVVPGVRPVQSESPVAWQRIGGVVVAIGGVALATWGGILAYRGTIQTNEAKDRLSAATSATTDAVWNRDLADFNAGKDLTNRGWITAGIGAGALLGGIILVVTAPEKQSNVALAPWVTADAGGLSARCAW